MAPSPDVSDVPRIATSDELRRAALERSAARNAPIARQRVRRRWASWVVYKLLVITLPMVLLACAVAVWIAGFDIIYACQDVGFDRTHGLHSAPARFGIPAALRLSTALHVLMVALLVGLGLSLGLGWIYYLGVAATAGLLVYEHRLITPSDMSRIDVAFFNVNSYIAGVLFLFTLADALL